MAADLAGNQWNEGDVSCSVVRRVVIPDAFYTLDGLLNTFMTILVEFGVFEDQISKELNEQLPFLATTQILMQAIKAGMGREVAHEIIKKYATTNNAASFFSALSSEKGFPLSIYQLNELIKNPADFTGAAVTQSQSVANQIRQVVKGEVRKVDLAPLI